MRSEGGSARGDRPRSDRRGDPPRCAAAGAARIRGDRGRWSDVRRLSGFLPSAGLSSGV